MVAISLEWKRRWHLRLFSGTGYIEDIFRFQRENLHLVMVSTYVWTCCPLFGEDEPHFDEYVADGWLHQLGSMEVFDIADGNPVLA